MYKNKNVIVGAIVFFATFSLYILTMPPTVYWQDAGIYLAGIKGEGNVYSPGYPLYMMLEIIWTHMIPIFNFTQKVELFSIICTSIMSVVSFLTLTQLLDKKYTLFNKIKSTIKDKKELESIYVENSIASASTTENNIKTVVAAVGAIVTTLNFNIWAQAINAEVYALHTLLFTTILYITIIIGKNIRIEKELSSNRRKLIYLVAFIYGISFANHPMAVVLLPFFVLLLITQRNIFFNKKVIIISLLIFILSGLTPYLYLPITASRHPQLNWGNPSTLNRFIKHVSGQTYLTGEQSIVFNDISRYIASLQEFLWEFTFIGLMLAVVGEYILYKKDKLLFLSMNIVIFSHIFFAIFYKQTTEYNSWLIPAHICTIFLICLAIYEALYWLLSRKKAKTEQSYLNNLGASCTLVLTTIFCLWYPYHAYQNFNELNRQNYYYAEDFGKNILRNLDPNSIIFMTGDQESSTIMYLQTVQKFRTDVTAFKNIEAEELTYSDGIQEIKRKYPNLIIPQDMLQQSEQDPIQTLVDNNIDKHSIYLMSKSLTTLDPYKYTLIPAAAMWKIVLKDQATETLDTKYWNFVYHNPKYYIKKERPLMSLKDPNKPGGINRVPFIQHMINFELQSWKNLGDWYLQQNDCTNAIQAYTQMQKIQNNIFEELPQIKQSIEACKS